MKIRALLLVLPLYAAPLVLFPEFTPVAEAARSSKAKKPKAKKTKVTPTAIAKWVKRGDSEQEIVARAEAAGYTPSKKDAKALRAKKVPRSLIAALGGPAETTEVAQKPGKVDLTKAARIEDIDFDSVPPPPGTPTWVSEKQKKEQGTAKLDRSLRPSAPFDESKAQGNASGEAAPRRKPIAASDS